MSTIRAPAPLSELLRGLDAVVFAARAVDDDWASVRSELSDAYELSRGAAMDERPVVYIVSSDALLGRRGAGNAMVATGLLSAARTLAAEMARHGVPVNVVGVLDETPDTDVAAWVTRLATGGGGGPTGELVQLGGSQIGKALA